jgi:hypothetical protein
MVGTSGNAAMRLRPVTPSGRNLPVLAKGNAAIDVLKESCTSPVSNAVMAGPMLR